MSLSIIPHPVSVEERDGTYALHSGQSITARGAASAALPAVQGLLANAGIALETADDGGALVLEENAALPDEGYQLSIYERNSIVKFLSIDKDIDYNIHRFHPKLSGI